MAETYAELMGWKGDEGDGDEAAHATEALSTRLSSFRSWLSEEAKVTIHPSVCVVNGEATDGTKNAPVLVLGEKAGKKSGSGSTAADPGAADPFGEVEGDMSLYDKTMGCQIRAVKEIKKDEVLFSVPRGAMITPDLVACSDAGRAVLACCQGRTAEASEDAQSNFWDHFENTTVCESKFAPRNAGPQVLIKIVQERKKAEAAWKKRAESNEMETADNYKLAREGQISTRAPLLAFLIHQRFSDASEPAVVSQSQATQQQFQTIQKLDDGNALAKSKQIQPPPNSPQSFAAYARTLPSFVSVPICWKRSELAVLSGCIPGASLLVEVASRTLQLAAEFTALLEAGIMERFPETFGPGLLTWERWLWAAAVSGSRLLPASCYTNAGDESPDTFLPLDPLEFQSPAEVWKELGVMVPFLDMLNHEIEANQVTWEPCVEDKASDVKPHPPRAIAHKKIRKGCELYTCYGDRSNSELISQYGFAQLQNQSDEVRLGWGFMDGVGLVDPPRDYVPNTEPLPNAVYESNDERAINSWWTEDRLQLLEREAFSSAHDSFMDMLRRGKKLHATAYMDGTYHPILLTAVTVATMPPTEIKRQLARDKVLLSKRHQEVLRQYLCFSFARKQEKLLQNLDFGLKDHFSHVKLWTKSSQGGLQYKPKDDTDDEQYISWQAFFDENAYKATIEVEKNFYALSPECCALAVYDGQLRALQASIDGSADENVFNERAIKQLIDLGFEIAEKEDEDDEKEERKDQKESLSDMEGVTVEKSRENKEGNSNGDNANAKKESKAGMPNGQSSNGSKSPRNRRRRDRHRKKNVTSAERPPAIKLHIGNLSYSTTPSHLYDYFSSKYGKDNVLECHIPTERETGRSRGFGFVAMPEEVAQRALESGQKHEIEGRVLKIAKSNSAGTVSSGRQGADGKHSNDRCVDCGYSPRYCTCAMPNVPGGPPPRDDLPRSHGRQRSPHHPPPPPLPRDYGYYSMPPPPPPPPGDWYRDYYDEPGRYRDYDRGRRPGRYEDYPPRVGDWPDEHHRRRRSREGDRGRDSDRSRDPERSRDSDRSRDNGRVRSHSRSSDRSPRSGRRWERDGSRSPPTSTRRADRGGDDDDDSSENRNRKRSRSGSPRERGERRSSRRKSRRRTRSPSRSPSHDGSR